MSRRREEEREGGRKNTIHNVVRSGEDLRRRKKLKFMTAARLGSSNFFSLGRLIP